MYHEASFPISNTPAIRRKLTELLQAHDLHNTLHTDDLSATIAPADDTQPHTTVTITYSSTHPLQTAALRAVIHRAHAQH